jgi:hypothetical protein
MIDSGEISRDGSCRGKYLLCDTGLFASLVSGSAKVIVANEVRANLLLDADMLIISTRDVESWVATMNLC